MFVHVATLYSVRAEAADHFIRSIRPEGDWQRIAGRLAPDLVASDLLQHESSPMPVFLCLDFWASREKYLSIRNSEIYEPLFSMRHQLAVATIELGVFVFPVPGESDAIVSQTADLHKTESRRVR